MNVEAMRNKIKEILYQQSELLAEESKKNCLPGELERTSEAMVSIAKCLLNP